MASKILHHRWHQTHPDPDHPGVWNFDVHLSGDHETVFFEV